MFIYSANDVIGVFIL